MEKCKEIRIDRVVATTELTIVISAYISQELKLNGNPLFVSKEITNKLKNRNKRIKIAEIFIDRYL